VTSSWSEAPRWPWPTTPGPRPAAAIADRHTDWLNDGVKGFLPGEDSGSPRVDHEGTCLTVSAGSPAYLLATKLLASPVSRDEEDTRLLYALCELTTVEEGLELVERYYPGRPIGAKVGFFLEELIASRG
jgi:hypothetical protein